MNAKSSYVDLRSLISHYICKYIKAKLYEVKKSLLEKVRVLVKIILLHLSVIPTICAHSAPFFNKTVDQRLWDILPIGFCPLPSLLSPQACRLPGKIY